MVVEKRHDLNEVIGLEGVFVIKEGRSILQDVNWHVNAGEKWVVLGPNGAGKTTMLQVASSYLGPTRGTMRLLGETFGQVDVRGLRERIGYAGSRPAELVRHRLAALEIVVTGKYASFVDEHWSTFTPGDKEFARYQLERLEAGHLADRRFGSLSSGERQRVLIARSLMTRPEVLLLDEATTGLDLGAREQLVSSLENLAAEPDSMSIVLITHHVEEIPLGFDHIAMMADGTVTASGHISTMLTSESLTRCFGHPLKIENIDGRYRAWMPRPDQGANE